MHRSRAKKKFDLLGLPNELLLSIFNYLDVFDSATLALACKRLAGIASNYSQLDVPEDVIRKCAQRPFEEAHFLKKRLGDKFFSKRLRYCWGCKHYVPRRRSHWKRKIGKRGWEGWCPILRQLTPEECWSLPGTQKMLASWNNGKALKCPRCKIFKQ